MWPGKVASIRASSESNPTTESIASISAEVGATWRSAKRSPANAADPAAVEATSDGVTGA